MAFLVNDNKNICKSRSLFGEWVNFFSNMIRALLGFILVRWNVKCTLLFSPERFWKCVCLILPHQPHFSQGDLCATQTLGAQAHTWSDLLFLNTWNFTPATTYTCTQKLTFSHSTSTSGFQDDSHELRPFSCWCRRAAGVNDLGHSLAPRMKMGSGCKTEAVIASKG